MGIGHHDSVTRVCVVCASQADLTRRAYAMQTGAGMNKMIDVQRLFGAQGRHVQIDQAVSPPRVPSK
jgi:hypothetical protein